MKSSGWGVAVLLLLSVVAVRGEEWYEQGHQSLLEWSNFDATVQQQGKFKFVKFFTRNCRYCRLLKQVEEQLRQEKEWGFEFHSVDCSLHYDLCQAKASMTAFPYIAIYNTYGKLHGSIGGFYPIDTMREAFGTIQKWQSEELLAQTGVTVAAVDLKGKEVEKREEQKPAEVKPEVKTAETSSDQEQKVSSGNADQTKKRVDEDDEGWSRSIKDGLKLTIILLGVIIFNKTVAPYLLPEQVLDDFSKPRTIQIPLRRQAVEQAKAEPSQCNKLVNDSI